MSDPVYDRFISYSSFGDKTQAGQMDGKLFAKLCKETGIIDKKCTATDVDLIFARAKPKGGRKLDYGAFSDACVMLAEKRFGKTFKEQGKEAATAKLYELIAGSQGPQANAVSSHDNTHITACTWSESCVCGWPGCVLILLYALRATDQG